MLPTLVPRRPRNGPNRCWAAAGHSGGELDKTPPGLRRWCTPGQPGERGGNRPQLQMEPLHLKRPPPAALQQPPAWPHPLRSQTELINSSAMPMGVAAYLRRSCSAPAATPTPARMTAPQRAFPPRARVPRAPPTAGTIRTQRPRRVGHVTFTIPMTKFLGPKF